MLEQVCNQKPKQDYYRHINSVVLLWYGFWDYWFVFSDYRDESCGTLFCSGGWEFPVTSRKSFYKVGNGEICNEATLNPEDNYPADLAMIPTGTKCGNNMVRKLTVSVDTVNKWTTDLGPHNVFLCLSGLLQPTVSRHQKHKSLRNK